MSLGAPDVRKASVNCPKCGKMWGEFLQGVFMRVCNGCKLRIILDTAKGTWYVVE